MSIVKSIALSIMLGVVSYGSTYKCTALSDINTQEILPIASTVSISHNLVSVNVDGVGKFHYRHVSKTPMGLMFYEGVDNVGYLVYSKLNPDLMLLGLSTAIVGCVKQTIQCGNSAKVKQ